jgi:DNA-binding transcriptional MerR regulator
VSVAVAARLLGVSRTTVEVWRSAGILVPAVSRRRRHEVTIESLVRLHSLTGELRRLGRIRELRDYIWWSGQDSADYAGGKLDEALAELREGDLDDEIAPSVQDLRWARQELGREEMHQD